MKHLLHTTTCMYNVLKIALKFNKWGKCLTFITQFDLFGPSLYSNSSVYDKCYRFNIGYSSK